MNLPAPRLQLRWRKPTENELSNDSIGFMNTHRWSCDYELVIPLGEHDIRRESGPELVAKLGTTFTSSGRDEPPDYAPFRDGAHAKWDSEALGGLPVYVICMDGTAKLQPENSEAA